MNDQIPEQSGLDELTRRDFLKGSSITSMVAMMGGVALSATKRSEAQATVGPPVKIGLIGCGDQGREILSTLATLPNAPVTAICDLDETAISRGAEFALGAKQYLNHNELLADPDIEAVVVATPSHRHRQIVVDAFQAGKHIYCEAPLAHTTGDAKSIGQAAKNHPRQYFQSGLQERAHPQRRFLAEFVHDGGCGRTVMARAQWQKKISWRHPAPNPERERDVNWRLNSSTSPGLVGEIGIHQLDQAHWLIGRLPIAITGFGSLIQWKDGRDVPDTVHAVLEYPEGVRMVYDGSLCNSFDAGYELYYGTDAALMVRDQNAWMFKEVDSPTHEWEVYATKNRFYKDVGIALVAGATKMAKKEGSGSKDEQEPAFPNTALYYALEAYVHNTYIHKSAVEDFILSFGDEDEEALAEYLTDMTDSKLPTAGYAEGYIATLTALLANQAILGQRRIDLDQAVYEI